MIKKILENYRPISTWNIKFILLILKSLMEETLNTIIGEHQSKAIKNRIILHSFLYLWHIDVSNKMNKKLSVISLELILSFLLCMSLDMETNSFIWLKLIH